VCVQNVLCDRNAECHEINRVVKHINSDVYSVYINANVSDYGGAFGDRTVLLDTCAGE
jgi:hypothetical protein